MTVFDYTIPMFVIALALAVVAAVIITAIAALILRLIGRRHAWAGTLVLLARVPFRILVLVGAVWFVSSMYLGDDTLSRVVDFVFRALFIGAATWLVCALLYFLEVVVEARYRIDVPDNRVARRVHTQLRILRRIGVVVVITCAIATVLLSVPGAGAVGASLFASAGLLSIVAGLAAQSTLANVFAGMQLAFNDALRVDDVVIVENEWGMIEEITLTYIVVHIWDDRRMVLPSTYFTTNPFQNWTRHASQLLGSIEFDLDWEVDPAAMREQLDRVVAMTDLWDGRVVVLQVTDAIGGFVRVRVLVSARDAPTLFDLRCLVRENLIAWINAENPEAVPLGRLEVRQAPEDARARPRTRDEARPTTQPITEIPGMFTGDEQARHRAQTFTESIPVHRDDTDRK